MKPWMLIVALLAVALIGAAAFIYSGWYNVAASEPHTAITEAIAATTMKQSVRAHARDLRAPDLSDVQGVKAGAIHYAENCQLCHGAPGRKPGELAEGLMPRPPDLAKTASNWTVPELFWIVKNGIRMTGMPAWGPTHDEQELWQVVAFITRLPQMSAEEYQRLTQDTSSHQHRHADGHRHSH